MKLRVTWEPFAVLIGAFLLYWGVGVAMTSTLVPDHKSPYKQILVVDKNGKEYWADVIADLESFSKEKDRSRLLRIIDNDARAAIYITQNDMAEMFTSMFIITSKDIDVNSPLHQRMGW